ncbi:MAG: permease [Pararhodobacter sp.]
MTEREPLKGATRAPDVMAAADWLFAQSAESLMTAIIDIQAGQFGPVGEMGATLAALRKALEAVLNERARIDRINSREGGARDGELDLGAARAEIRRRMDRLRAAADTRGVSGGSE